MPTANWRQFYPTYLKQPVFTNLSSLLKSIFHLIAPNKYFSTNFSIELNGRSDIFMHIRIVLETVPELGWQWCFYFFTLFLLFSGCLLNPTSLDYSLNIPSNSSQGQLVLLPVAVYIFWRGQDWYAYKEESKYLAF